MRDEDPRGVLLGLLAPRLASFGLPATPSDGADLVATGLLDSLDVVTLIGEVEERTGRPFAAERFEAEGGITIGGLLQAFGA